VIDHSVQKDFHLLVFTDLDGTLLDHETYSFQSTLPALNALKKKNIPLIICTSKARAEIEKVRLELNNSHPFISENGGAVFIPKGYFSHEFPFHREDFKYLIIELGTSYSQLREVFNQMRTRLPTQIKGFGDLSPDQVADLCGLSLSEAKLAKEREYDEPFILRNETSVETIQKIASHSNLHIDRGGRFYHLMGENDKGKAVLLLKDIYKKEFAQLKTIALGDSQNDLPMLKVVDYPILVQKPDGSYYPSVKVENLIFAPGKGPSGWNDAVLKLLDKLL
jgi:mannosyl-3-phosphoglycerate phosphatase